MTDRVDDVTIVGAGDSGLLAGLSLRRLNQDIDITIVDDLEAEIPQVGKSTFYEITPILHERLDIDLQRFIREVKPIWKCSVYFRDWCDRHPFHYPFDENLKFPDPGPGNTIEMYSFLHDEQYARHKTKNEEIVEQRKSPWYYDLSNSTYQLNEPVAYHLDTTRFNGFLRELCRERDVSLIDDKIFDADVDGDRIECIRSEGQRYESDLYIDASGFRRVLVGALKREFREFDLPLDSAVKTEFDRPLSEVIPATVVESGEYGWFWTIDTYEKRDVGYVYASEFVSDQEATAEFLDHWSEDIPAESVTDYEFSSGYYKPSLAENCLAIGNAGGFVEPLQSTGLTFSAAAAIRLANLLSAHGRILDDACRDAYNSWVTRGWESIYDFILTHYKFAPCENEFWESLRAIDISPRLQAIVSEYDRHGFDTNVPAPTEHGTDVEPLDVFTLANFYMLMRNLGRKSEFYETHEFAVPEPAKRASEQAYKQRKEAVETDHITTEEFYKGVLEYR